ncbi:protein kinase [Streptomyces sp. NPDC048290]|uniref:serine/threonine-protein kinase n=1 Tax=Streptomyces sp. NPDC048290 TaxID=3155811 RepID=UPI0034243ED5
MSGEPGEERVVAGRYRLLSPLGEGGMGTVWRARDEVLHREVAVKEVRAPAGLPAPDVERMYARLEREAWAAARVSHRNVVTVYDVATEEGRPWIVMELVRGVSLSETLEADGPMTPQRAALVGAEVLAALRAAHEAGVLHRDVKPGNVLLANDGRVVLTDFGIATLEGTSALTMTGEVVGSPEFLAPERALGRTPGPESDLWSLGVLLYAAVEGISPFRQDTPLSTLRAVVEDALPPPRRAGALGPVVAGLLRKDPAERPAAADAERELRLVGAGGTPRADTAWSTSTAPTVAAPTPVAAETRPTGTDPGTAPAVPTRDRRAVPLLVAGVVALVLAIGGLTYALLDRTGGDGGGAAGASSEASGAPDEGDAGGAGGEPSGGSGVSGTPGGAVREPSGAASPQSVTVTVAGAHTDYAGVCPPPGSEGPAFTATFTVGRLPAEVSYRWVARDGEVVDEGWRTLSFPAGGERTRRESVTVTAYDASGTYRNEVSVEVREPVEATSNAVAFSVTCVTGTPTWTPTETPTGGASAPASGAASGSATPAY